MAGVHGAATKLAFGDSTTVDKVQNFVSESLAETIELIDANGLRGTRSHQSELVRQGRKRVGGSVVLNPTAVNLEYILPKIYGASNSGTSYPLGESLTAFYIHKELVSEDYLYTGCCVNRATFSSAPGQVLQCALDIIAVSQSSGSYPSISLDITTKPFVMSDLAVTFDGGAITPNSFSLTIDNAINTERFFNSQSLTSPPLATDRMVTVSLTIPFDTQSDRYPLIVEAGNAIVATFTNGAVSLAFTMAAVQFVKTTPVVSGLGEVLLQLSGTARMTSTTRELTTVLDSTP